MKHSLFASILAILCFFLVPNFAYSDDAADEAPTDESQAADDAVTATEAPEATAAEPKLGFRIFAHEHPVSATIETTAGAVCCDLFVEDHPLTVLNFKSLAEGKPAWTDRKGEWHATSYYAGTRFSRSKGDYIISGDAAAGTNFHIKDERCAMHQPVKGALVMVQNHPGQASAKFMILDRNAPEFKGMFTVFGQCRNSDVIDKLTKEDASIVKISIHDRVACE